MRKKFFWALEAAGKALLIVIQVLVFVSVTTFIWLVVLPLMLFAMTFLVIPLLYKTVKHEDRKSAQVVPLYTPAYPFLEMGSRI